MTSHRVHRAFRPLATYLERSVSEGIVPGVVAAVGGADSVHFLQALGQRALRPRRERMTPRTILDLASLTKILVTAPLVVERASQRRISLLDPLERHLTETRGTRIGPIPLHMLLTHTAGFQADNPLEDYAGSKADLLAAIAREPLESEPGSAFRYSDVGYVLLQLVLERIERRRLDRIAEAEIFGPLRFRDTRFGTAPEDRPRCAPTEQVLGRWLRGRVHDPRARAAALRGVAGHAGVFGTAAEVARFCAMMLRRGVWNGRRVLSEETIRGMTTDQCGGNLGVRRGFGFDLESPYSAPRGRSFSAQSYGHTGWTGVSVWIDPDRDGYLVLLTNAIHPDGHKDLKAFRADAATLAGEALRSKR